MTYAQHESERNHPNMWTAQQECDGKDNHQYGERCVLRLRVVEHPELTTAEMVEFLVIEYHDCIGGISQTRQLILRPEPARHLLQSLRFYLE